MIKTINPLFQPLADALEKVAVDMATSDDATPELTTLFGRMALRFAFHRYSGSIDFGRCFQKAFGEDQLTTSLMEEAGSPVSTIGPDTSSLLRTSIYIRWNSIMAIEHYATEKPAHDEY